MYSKNFLSDVIFRIDFQIILDLTDKTPVDFQKKINADYPNLEPVYQQGVRIEQASGELSTQILKSITWKFQSKNRRLTIELNADSFVFLSKDYVDFETFKTEVDRLTKFLFTIYPEITLNRIGLRYINRIEIPDEENMYDWKRYICGSLIKNLEFTPNDSLINRAMTNLVFKFEPDTQLSFQYGIFNEVFPQELATKVFMLDYDCHTSTVEQAVVETTMLDFHKKITVLFEKSIKKDLRTLLNNSSGQQT